MNEIRTLTALELRKLYGFNKFRHTKDKKARNNYRLLLGAFLILIAMVVCYVGGLVYGLCILGMGNVVMAYLAFIASLLVFAFGIFKAGNQIFGHKGYDLLASMPLRQSSIVISRFVAMYAEDCILTLVVMVPGAVVYAFMQKPDFGFYLSAVLGSLLIPAIPLVAATLIGTVIMALSSRMKNKSLVQTVLMLLLVVGVLVGSFGMGSFAEELTPEMLTDLARTVSALIGKLYPPAVWLGQGSLGGLALFAALSVGLMALAILIAAKHFHSIMRRLMTFSAGKSYAIGQMESRGLLKALYLRELKRYFSSSVYVTNTIVGPIMGCLLAGGLCFAGVDTVTQQIPLDLGKLMPFVFTAAFGMMTTTAVSISMEGKQFWIVKSLPIPAKTLFDSKILLNLSLMLPFYVLSEIFLVIALKPGMLELLWLLLVPGSILLFAVVFGITVNLKLHSFDWEQETQPVKQSASTALGGFAAPLISIALGFGIFFVPEQMTDLAMAAVCVLLLAGTAFLYQHNNKAKLESL